MGVIASNGLLISWSTVVKASKSMLGFNTQFKAAKRDGQGGGSSIDNLAGKDKSLCRQKAAMVYDSSWVVCSVAQSSASAEERHRKISNRNARRSVG